MSPDAARAMYHRLIQSGEEIKLRRYTGTGTSRPFADYVLRAKVAGYTPEELVGNIQQGDRNIIALAEDVFNAQFPVPITPNDKVIVRGRELDIKAVDDSTRRIGGELIAYQIQACG